MLKSMGVTLNPAPGTPQTQISSNSSPGGSPIPTPAATTPTPTKRKGNKKK